MDIIKHIKDLSVSRGMSEFVTFINERAESRIVVVKIKSREYIRISLLPQNDLNINNYYPPGTPISQMILPTIENEKNKPLIDI